jgi:hypothetical protein
MSLSIELERDENLTVGQWETFLRQARRAGASDDTPVAEVMHDGTDVLWHTGWRSPTPREPPQSR